MRPNHSMKPTAPLGYNFSLFATTPCRGLSLSRLVSMIRCLFAMALLPALSSCQATDPKTTFVARGQTYCAIHRIPLVTAHGYEAPAGMFMHSRHPRYYLCEEKYPNHIWATRSLYRSNIRNVP